MPLHPAAIFFLMACIQLSIEILKLGQEMSFTLGLLVNSMPTNCSSRWVLDRHLADHFFSAAVDSSTYLASLAPALERTDYSDVLLQWHLSLGRNAVRSSSGKLYISTMRRHRRSRLVRLHSGTWLTFSRLSLTVSGTVATFMIQLKEVCGDFC